MLKLIVGVKGTGKTKMLIESANASLEKTDGCVVVIEKGTKLIHEIKYQARLLDTKEYVEDKDLLDDVPALKVKYSGKINDKTYLNEQIIACREGQVYLITLVVPEESYEKVETVIETVKKDFKFAE